MAIFSVNQNRQLYVANAYKATVADTDSAGTISVKADSKKEHFYFPYKGAESLMRSDLIDLKNVIYAKATDASQMTRELKSVTVTLDKNVNEGNPISGQDYILRIVFKQAFGNSDTNQYLKYGAVHGTATMTASDFYKELAVSLAKNFSREITPFVDIVLTDHETAKGSNTTNDVAVPVLKDGKIQKISALAAGHEYTAVLIDEVEQPWRLGVRKQVPVFFDVYPTTVTFEGDEVVWGIAESTEPAGKVLNGKIIADLEYFCMGERGDQYRNMGWPHNIETKYLVDPTKQYNTIDIHYAYVGDGVSVQKSEKDITIVVPKVGATNSVSNKLTNDIIGAINTATGLSIAELDKSSS
mgnify:CR=1 FL=1